MQQTFSHMRDAPTVTIYTDGGSDPNPGPGGWAAILCFPDRQTVLAGNAPHTTNNRMEMQAAIAALAYLNGQYGPCQVDLYTDSEYLCQGITQWIDDWFANGWKATNGSAIKNQALWRKLYDLTHVHHVQWHWVRGHAGDPLNERVDQLVRQVRQELPSAKPLPAPPPHLPSSLPPVEISVGVSYLGNVRSGGWAAILRSGAKSRVLSGHTAGTTSNALLLHAAAEALNALRTPCAVTVYTVGDYLARGASQWVRQWQQQGWRTREGTPVKNRAPWEALIAATERHHVSWQVVREKPLPEDLAEAKQAAIEQAAISD